MKSVTNIVLNNFTHDSRVEKISDSLMSFNYQVTVVALHDKGLPEKEKKHGIFTHRIKLKSRYWYKTKPAQLLKYLEFIVLTVYYYRKSDIIHCNDLSTLPIGFFIKILNKKAKLVYDCHEYETETHNSKGIEKIIKKALERALIKYPNKIITVSKSIANEYTRLYQVKKPDVILNCPKYSTKKSTDILRKTLKIESNQKIFIYQGGFTAGRGIEILLETFPNIKNHNIVLIFMGYGPLENVIQEKILMTENIFLLPSVEPDKLLEYTSSADYGILFYEDTCLNHRYCSPNKVFEYFMAGLPVISSNLFEMRYLVEKEGVGVVAKENSSKGLEGAILSILTQNYSILQKNVKSARKKYCWENQENILHRVYDAL